MTTTTTITDIVYTYEPTKKEILERLMGAGHITFNEMWTLLQDEPEVRYVPMPPAGSPTWTMDNTHQ